LLQVFGSWVGRQLGPGKGADLDFSLLSRIFRV
jgi:hypothetical protein